VRRTSFFLIGASLMALPVKAADTQIYPGDTFTRTVEAASLVGSTRLEQRRLVLSQLRAVCESRRLADKRRCADGMAILMSGYAELQARRAQERTVAE
jgi:hypothetical protein